MYGVAGKALVINLTKNSIKETVVKESVYERFLGGIGTASYWMFTRSLHEFDPFSPDNPLIFSTGPLTGTTFPSSGRFGAVTISPLTNNWASSISGTRAGVQLKRNGYDMMIITGKADNPVYLSIIDGEAEIRPADHLWGLGIFDTTKELKREGRNLSILSIGQAGENLVSMANIMCDRERAFGRCGFGAVMGSKNLKAIVVRGKRDIELASPEDVALYSEELKTELMENEVTKNLSKFGTGGLTSFLNYLGILPTKYFKKGQFELADDLSGDEIVKKYNVKRTACYACPIACGKRLVTEKGSIKAPEYETLVAFGPLLMNEDYDVILEANKRCDDYGLDTISTGNACGFAIEAMERGILEKSGDWGDGELILKLIDNIAFRKKEGKILSSGVASASKVLGADFAMHVKGLETPMHEPRGMQSLGLAYATALRGCDHLSANTNVIEMFGMPVEDLGIPANLSEFTFEDVDRKARTFAWAVKRSQDFWTLHDTLIMCKFTTIAYQIPPRKFSTMLYSVTGKTFEFREVIKIGERVFNLVRRMMVDRGIDKKDDTLPKRFLRTGLPRHEPQGKKGEIKDFDRMIEEYYSIRGWDDRGIPLESTLSSLEIFEEM